MVVNCEWVENETWDPSETRQVSLQSPGLGVVVVEWTQKEEEEVIGLFLHLTLALDPSEEDHQVLLLAIVNEFFGHFLIKRMFVQTLQSELFPIWWSTPVSK